MLKVTASVIFTFMFLTLAPSFARIAHAKESAKPVRVEWYNPEVLRSVKKNRARVRLSGQTMPKTKIKIATDSVPFITKKEKAVSLPTKQVWAENLVQADERGAFEIDMDLPFATAQIPFEVTTPTGQKQNYQLSIIVDRNDVKIEAAQAKVKNSPYSRRKWGVWGGVGANFLKYDQVISGLESAVGFQSFTGPALFMKVARSLNRDWAAQMSANYSPGKVASSDSINVGTGSYAWTFLTGEATYFPPQWKLTKSQKRLTEFGIQAGLQYHNIPFVTRSSASNASVETNDVIMMAVGATAIINYSRYWLFETFLRYQYPLSSGGLYDIQSKFAFDGSLGMIYKWKPDWRLGGFWYGQWHQYKYKNAPDAFSGGKVSGDQDLFFSNLEFRIGYEFD